MHLFFVAKMIYVHLFYRKNDLRILFLSQKQYTHTEEEQLKSILYLINVFIKVSKELPIQNMGCPSERETRQSCSSLALPHKPTRPDSPDPIWRAGSWFSLLEV